VEKRAKKAVEAAAAVTDSTTKPRKTGRLGLKPADFFIGALSLAVAAWVTVTVYAGAAPTQVAISGNGSNYVYPLSEDREIPVQGSIGITLVHIRDGEVSISASPCKNKTCVQTGAISGNGEWAACLPNGVFVRIDADDNGEDALDAVVR